MALLKPVLTLDQPEFRKTCLSLIAKVPDNRIPDLICGIVTGGQYVAEDVMLDPRLRSCKIISIKLQRPETNLKKKVNIGWLLKMFPRRLNDVLRNVEDALREKRFKNAVDLNESLNIAISQDDILALEDSKRILVVDDAVDSGVTLLNILKCIKRHAPHAEISTAAITVTFSSPKIMPDYFLYRCILLRFPWSNDA